MKSCTICQEPACRELIDFGELPICHHFVKIDETEDRHPVALGQCDVLEIGTVPNDFFDPAGTRFASLGLSPSLTVDLFALRFDVIGFGNGTDPSTMVSAAGGGLAPMEVVLDGTTASSCIGPGGGVGACAVPEPRVAVLLAAAGALALLPRWRRGLTAPSA